MVEANGINPARQGAEQVAWYTRYVYQGQLEECLSPYPIQGSGIDFERRARLANMRQTLAPYCADLFAYCGEEQSSYLVYQFINSPRFFDSPAKGLLGAFCLFVQSRYYQFPVLSASSSVIAARYALQNDDSPVLASLPILAAEDEYIELILRASVVDGQGRFNVETIRSARPELAVLRVSFDAEGGVLLQPRTRA